MANTMWSDSAEELQAGSEEVINPHPLQILVSTLNTQFSQVLKALVKGIQLKLKTTNSDVCIVSPTVILLQQGSGKQNIQD